MFWQKLHTYSLIIIITISDLFEIGANNGQMQLRIPLNGCRNNGDCDNPQVTTVYYPSQTRQVNFPPTLIQIPAGPSGASGSMEPKVYSLSPMGPKPMNGCRNNGNCRISQAKTVYAPAQTTQFKLPQTQIQLPAGPLGPSGPMGSQSKLPQTQMQLPSGPPGPPGPMGPKGDRGMTGAKGEKGNSGNDGMPGLKGARGKTGSKGVKGDPGLNGNPGRRGHRGFPGPTGPAGAKGDKGNPGEKGSMGSPGKTGYPGIKGDMGPRGPPGLPGPPGPIAITKPKIRNGQSWAPAVTCSQLFTEHPDLNSGNYWIDPSGKNPQNKNLLYCEKETHCTCILPKLTKTEVLSYKGKANEVWLSELLKGRILEYEIDSYNLKLLQQMTKHATQTIIFNCVNTVAYKDANVISSRGLKLLTWNDAELKPEGSRDLIFKPYMDNCNRHLLNWEQTVIKYSTEKTQRLPIVDIAVRDVRNGYQAFAVQVDKVCFH